MLAAGQADAAIDEFRVRCGSMSVSDRLTPTWPTPCSSAARRAKHEVLREALEVRPGDRKALAFLAAAAHETGDDQTRTALLDFERLMVSRDWPVAPGYDSVAAFNEALLDHVTGHPTLKREPLSKSTRGSQTGELLDAERDRSRCSKAWRR